MRSLVLMFATLLALASAAPALAQHKGGRERGQDKARQSQNMSHEERQRLRQDVESARGNYGRQEQQRQQQGRMDQAERERLRRDVQDANRDLRRR